MSILPPARPEMTRETAVLHLRAAGLTDDFALVGRRGYYRDSMGEPGVQERGIFDDAIALVTPTTFRTFNANCDPSRYEKGMASLLPGVCNLKVGVHNRTKSADRRYKALIQDSEFVVHRDDTLEFKAGEVHPKFGRCLGNGQWAGWFGINIHRGGNTTTGSAGCQTIPPAQWDAFIALVELELQRHDRTRIPYVLTERGDL